METDVHKLYTDLNQLLDDICKFLSSDKVASFSHKDKKIAEALINRSKVQLQEINKLQKLSANEEYVDMDRKKDDIHTNTETIVVDDGLSYHKDLPAKDALRNVKYGEIMMKRKFLLGFEKMKKVYATIHYQWLVIYFSDKDMKPICTFDLKDFNAKKADNERNSNFELIGTSNNKVYYFLASTHKDMLQWVAQINSSHNRVVLIHKGNSDLVSEDDDPTNIYDEIRHNNGNQHDESEEEDDEAIYYKLEDKPTQQNNNTIITDVPKKGSDPGPPLPGRRPMNRHLIPIKPPVIKPTNNSDSEESITSYETPYIDQNVSTEPRAINAVESPSEEEEDPIYDEFINVKDEVESIKMKSPEILTESSNPINFPQMETEANTEDQSEYQNTSITEIKNLGPNSPKVSSENSSFDKSIKEAIGRMKGKKYSPTEAYKSEFNTSSPNSNTQKFNFSISNKPNVANKPSITMKSLSTFGQRNDY